MLKARGAAALRWLHTKLYSIWNAHHPDRLETFFGHSFFGVVVLIWTENGDTQECNNYRLVTPVVVQGKALERILLDRVRQKLLTHQRHEQSGYTRKKSTEDRILSLLSSPSVCVTSALGCCQRM